VRSSLFLFLVALTALLSPACSSDPPVFPPLEYDSGLECSSGSTGLDAGGDASGTTTADLGPCPTGEVCLQGRGYAACMGDAQCSSTEMCIDGTCVPRTGPRPDSGPMDSGPTDPCAELACEAPEVCHPRGVVCVQCLDGTTCSAGAPVCDIAYGSCSTFQPRDCSPCNVDGDCTATDSTDYGDCITRDGESERVCVRACSATSDCEPGLDCGSDGRCAPRVGSCTGFIAAVDGKRCLEDAECVPLGSTPAVGQCAGIGEAADGGMPIPGTCRQPCGIPSDCPTATSCIGGFCVPS